jgi:class 3 adenylate cyclase
MASSPVTVHSGRPTLTSGGYIGLAIHPVARVCAVRHSGQIRLTATTMRALGDTDTVDVELVSLGNHTLAGLPEAVALMQATLVDGLHAFPPLRLG